MSQIASRPASLSAVSTAGLPAAEPNSPFLFVHDPLNWEVLTVDGETFAVPRLKAHPLEGGINGIKPGRGADGPPDYTQWMGVQLKAERVVLGSAALVAYYLHCFDCRGPTTQRVGLRYHERWERPEVVGGQYRPSYDLKGFLRWRLELVRSGVIAPIHERTLHDLCERQGGRVQRLEARQAESPIAGRSSVLRSEESRLKAMLELQDRLAGLLVEEAKEEPPAPESAEAMPPKDMQPVSRPVEVTLQLPLDGGAEAALPKGGKSTRLKPPADEKPAAKPSSKKAPAEGAGAAA